MSRPSSQHGTDSLLRYRGTGIQDLLIDLPSTGYEWTHLKLLTLETWRLLMQPLYEQATCRTGDVPAGPEAPT